MLNPLHSIILFKLVCLLNLLQANLFCSIRPLQWEANLWRQATVWLHRCAYCKLSWEATYFIGPPYLWKRSSLIRQGWLLVILTIVCVNSIKDIGKVHSNSDKFLQQEKTFLSRQTSWETVSCENPYMVIEANWLFTNINDLSTTTTTITLMK